MKCVCGLLVALAVSVEAGIYVNNFDLAADSSTNLGDGTVISGDQAFVYNPTGSSGVMVLTQDLTGGKIGNFVLPDLDPAAAIIGFTATFDLYFKASGAPADGLSFNFGSISGALPYGGEEGLYSSGPMLSVGWDTYDNGSDPLSIEVFVNGASVANNTATPPIVETAGGSFQNVSIVYDENGLDVVYAGTSVYTDLDVSGFTPQSGAQFGFAARTGGSYEDAFVDNVSVETVPEPASVLLVFMGMGLIGLKRRLFAIR